MSYLRNMKTRIIRVRRDSTDKSEVVCPSQVEKATRSTPFCIKTSDTQKGVICAVFSLTKARCYINACVCRSNPKSPLNDCILISLVIVV